MKRLFIALLCFSLNAAYAQFSGPALNSPPPINPATINVTGSTIPANGMYLSGANTLDLSTNSTRRLEISSAGEFCLNCTPVSGVPFRVVDANNDAGLEWQRNSATVGTLLSYNRIGAGYTELDFQATQYSVGISGTAKITYNGTTLAVVGTPTFSAIASSGAAQSGYLCYNTTGGVVTYDGGATCLVSREEYKDNLGAIHTGLADVMALRPFWGRYKNGTPMADHAVQPFLGARHTAKVDARLASFDASGAALGVRYENMSAVLVAAMQEQQAMIKRLQREVKALRHALNPF